MAAKFGYWETATGWAVGAFSGGEPVGDPVHAGLTYTAALNLANELNHKHETEGV